MADPSSAISNEVLLAAFAAVQVLTAILGKVVDFFVDRGRIDPVEAKLDELIKRDVDRSGNVKDFLSRHADNSRMIADLYTMHKVIDEDGRPAWYFPKKMLDMGEKNLEMLREISMAQKETVHEMKMLVKELARMRNPRDVD